MKRINVKYRDICSSMRRRILSGEFPQDKRLPGQFALAREYNVSAITANRALDELELSGLINRRIRSGSYVRKKPRFISELFVVASGKFENEESWIGEYWNGISEKAESMEIPAQLLKATDSMFKQKVLVEGGMHGVILLGFEDDTLVKKLEKLKIPHVLTAIESSRVKYCAVENRRQAAKELSDALFKAGCRKIVFVGDMSQPNHVTASKGFTSFLSNSSRTRGTILNTTSDSVSESIRDLLKGGRRPDGIIFAGSSLPFAALPSFFQSSGHPPRLGFMTDNSNVMLLKGLGIIASYSQSETGKNSFALLHEIIMNQDPKPRTVYTEFKILT